MVAFQAALFIDAAQHWSESLQHDAIDAVHLTGLHFVPQGAAFAPKTSARGTAKKLHARALRAYLDAGHEAARAAGGLSGSPRPTSAPVDTLKANAQGFAAEDGRRLPGHSRCRLDGARARHSVVGRGGRRAGWRRGEAGRRKGLRGRRSRRPWTPRRHGELRGRHPLSATSVAAVEWVWKLPRRRGRGLRSRRDELFGAAYGKGAWVEAGEADAAAVSASTLGDAIVCGRAAEMGFETVAARHRRRRAARADDAFVGVGGDHARESPRAGRPTSVRFGVGHGDVLYWSEAGGTVTDADGAVHAGDPQIVAAARHGDLRALVDGGGTRLDAEDWLCAFCTALALHVGHGQVAPGTGAVSAVRRSQYPRRVVSSARPILSVAAKRATASFPLSAFSREGL